MTPEKERWIFIAFLVVVIIVLIIVVSCNKKPQFEHSDYEWHGEFIEDLIEELCCEKGIDYEGTWLFRCPKCPCGRGGYVEKNDTGSIAANLHFVYPEIKEIKPREEVVISFAGDNCKTYCATCKYPLGYDWKIHKVVGDVAFDNDLEWIVERPFGPDGPEVKCE